jgi:hypothetical protein
MACQSPHRDVVGVCLELGKSLQVFRNSGSAGHVAMSIYTQI